MADDLYDKILRKLRLARGRDENYQTAKNALWDEVCEDPDRYLKMFFANWFNHNWSRELPEIASKPDRVKSRPRIRETPEQTVERRKFDANLQGIALMNGFLPDGETRLKNATGKQLRQCGGWFMRLTKFVKPTETLGRKLTAEQVANLWTQVQ